MPSYYQPLQPGLSQVGNLPLPLDDQTLQGMGYSPMAAALPQQTNPASALGPNAVAGGEGAPLPPAPSDLSDIRQVAGSGVQPVPGQPTPDQFRSQLAPPPQAHESAPPIARGISPEANLAFQATGKDADKPVLLSTAPKAEQKVERQEDELSRLYAQADAEAQRGGGQPRQLGVASETRKFTQSAPVDPELAAKIKLHQDELDQAQSNAVEDQALHEGDRLEQEHAAMQQQAALVQQQIQERQAVDQRIRKLQAQSDAAQQEIANRTPKGLSDYWKDRGTAVQIGSAIAAVIGGWFQGQNGGAGPNQGIEVINKNIDRWMNDQQQQYENAKSDAQLKDNAYKEAIAIYGSPETAQAQMQLQAYAARDAMIQNTAKQIGTQDALNNAQILLQAGQLEREKAQAQARSSIQVEQTLKMQGGGGPAGGGVIGALKRRAEIRGLANQVTGNTIPEREQALKEQEAGDKGRAASQVSEDVVRSAERVKQLTSSMAGREPGETAGKANAAYLELKANMLKQYGWSGRQMAVIDEAIKDPTKFARNPGAVGQLDEIIRIAKTKSVRSSAAHAAGIEESGPLPGEESQE